MGNMEVVPHVLLPMLFINSEDLLMGYSVFFSLPVVGLLRIGKMFKSFKEDNRVKVSLEPGGYLYPSLNLDPIFTLLKDRDILVIGRNAPLFEKYGIPALWISKVEKENTISPTDLVKLHYLAINSVTEDSVLILDGIEYLILENGFESVFKFLVHLKDHILMKKAIFIVVVDERALEKRHIFLLEREFERISPAY
ncbi:DUF835 domain-containing protein [Thermococcus sp. EP1]|uniref:DUF835 domain-containing protein n=1 Tax=Thermococcus sp. EP1 TaxID=1591054 RepID=UPI0009E822F6|nr:DUF835 domain-containing protein [Thermococcus sp. EP1]